MNKFVQFLLGLCSLIWIVIGGAVIVGGLLLTTFLIKEKPFDQIAPLLQMVQGGSGGGLSGGADIGAQLNDPQVQACVRRALGDARFNDLMSGKIQPTAQDISKATACAKK